MGLLGIEGIEDESVLGRGAYGVVYRAFQSNLKRPVAVKVLVGAFDDRALRRFARECATIGSLSGQPGILTIYSAGHTDSGSPYLIMPLLEGGSLADRLRDGPVPVDKVVRYGVALGRALDAAHQHGILHLDVKPGNVLLDRWDQPQLADFGIARFLEGEQAGHTATTAGTPGFAAPEIFDGREPSVSSDVYGLGATLHALASGRSPFSASGAGGLSGLLRQIAEQPPPDLRPFGVPDELCRILERAMAKDPSDRYPTMAQLVEALEALPTDPSFGSRAAVIGASAGGIDEADAPTQDERSILAQRDEAQRSDDGHPGEDPGTVVVVNHAQGRFARALGRSEGVSRPHRVAALVGVAVLAVVVTALFALRSRDGGDGGLKTGPASEVLDLVGRGNGEEVRLSWTSEPADPGVRFEVYRAEGLGPVDTALGPVATTDESSFEDRAVDPGGQYTYVVATVDQGGDPAFSPPLTVINGVLEISVNFQADGTDLGTGSMSDHGEPFGARPDGRSYGWVDPTSGEPVSLVGLGRTRDSAIGGAPDDRAYGLMHMQAGQPGSPPIPNHVTQEDDTQAGSWEIELPDGAYTVTVMSGDAQYHDSEHWLNIEGRAGIIAFDPDRDDDFVAEGAKWAEVTRVVEVTDGRLTLHADGGTNSKINFVDITSGSLDGRPWVLGTDVPHLADGVDPQDLTISTTRIVFPAGSGGLDPATVTKDNVVLTKLGAAAAEPIDVTVDAGSDTFTVSPSGGLESAATYVLTISDRVASVQGEPLVPFQTVFHTGPGDEDALGDVGFEQRAQPVATAFHTSLVVGADRRLYAGTIDGRVLHYGIAPEGDLGAPGEIHTVRTATGSERILIGMAFDPASTAEEPLLWVSHSSPGFTDVPNWGGRISLLRGPDLETYEDVVVNLPRSSGDHLTNSLAFGPDGALYATQGSMSATGAHDPVWGRDEVALSAAVLRIDTPAALARAPVDVRTGADGAYDPDAPDAPVTVYASGIRNGYDLVWHSDGSLYVPTNGSAAGGNTPGYDPLEAPPSCNRRLDGPPPSAVRALSNVSERNDLLYRVVEGGYYGHPNPERCEWVLDGGNPTGGPDPVEVGEYPVGQLPDPNWRGIVYDFGEGKSPNGAVEYTSPTFGGALIGTLLVARWSANDDIVAVRLDAPDGGAVAHVGIEGFTGFVDPLDVIEDRETGNLYVAQSPEAGTGSIVLLRPAAPGGLP